MEDLSEIHLDFDGKLSSLEELYDGSLDHDFSEINGESDTSRPSSTMSFASWSFSPITEEDMSEITDAEQSADEQTTSPPLKDCKNHGNDSTNIQNNSVSHMTQNKLTMNVMNFNQPLNQHIVNQPVCITVPNQPISNVPVNQYPSHLIQQNSTPCHVIQQRNNRPCEFVYPNTFTYHQSVNIHNYVGGQVWRPDYVLERPVMCTSPPQRPETPQLKMEFTDPLVNLNTSGLELARCSTPEYLMALNSLNSPPRPNHSAAANFNCSILDDSVIDKRHDSGYISDVTESPVMQLQAGNMKYTHGKTTGMPPQPPPLFRLANLPIHPFNSEKNVPIHAHQFIQTPHSVPSFRPQCSNIKPINPLFHPGGYLQSTLQPTQQKPKLEIKPQPQTDNKFKNMADYQLAKKVKSAPVKRKAEPETPNKCSDSDNKRRRHNEPLNNKALQVLNEWYETHASNPYPNKAEKDDIAKRGGLSMAQVKSWFANKRNRSHNTRPKKQKKEMEGRLLDICHQLARDASKPNKDNAYYIQQLSSILDSTKYL